MALDHTLLEQAKARARAARNAALARMHGGAVSSREDAIREAVARARAAVARASQYGGSSSREDAIREAVARARAAAADQAGGAWHVAKRLGGRKQRNSKAKHVGRKAVSRVGMLNPRLRTYVAAVGLGGAPMQYLTGDATQTVGKRLYFHGLPSAAAKKVLTALTKTRKSAATRARGGQVGPVPRVGAGVVGGNAADYSLVQKGSITQASPVRITLVEVTKGLRKKTAQPANSIAYGAASKKGKLGKYYQYHYYGYQEASNESFVIRGQRINVANKNVVVRSTIKNPTFAGALAAKQAKANVARVNLRGRRINRQ